MHISLDQSNRSRALWSTCLASAFRTALACTIVAVTTLYGPASIQRLVAFPAFSYFTVVVIATDGTLGDTFRGFWLVVHASVQSVAPAILSLWLIGPARLSTSTAALAVGIGAFVIVLPGDFTHLESKRIALGQTVLLYVIAFTNGGAEGIMHPVHVAASTMIGALACVLALLLPFPRLACREVEQNSKLLDDNASERLKLFVKAFCAEDNTSALASISRSKSLAAPATKLFQTIKRYQDSMQWERLPLKLICRHVPYINVDDKYQGLESLSKGMEMALHSTSFPLGVVDGELKKYILKLVEDKMSLNKIISSDDDDSIVTIPESKAENVWCIQTVQTIPQTRQGLSPLFFLFCLNLLHGNLPTTTSSTTANEKSVQKNQDVTNSSKQSLVWSDYLSMKVSHKRVAAALKCSLSLGISVFFGLKYCKDNAHWSGLTVAISFAATREATFQFANLRAQGTVLGTVYGVLGCFLFHNSLPTRIFSLFPWFIFTSFLQRSKMYGQGGGLSAVVGAVLILGRTHYGTPTEFAIARIIEVFIGLSSSIIVELTFQPTRASTHAKTQLSRTLGTLQECINTLSFQLGRSQMEEGQSRLKIEVKELGNFIGEAEAEPNFWFLPFHGACYRKLLRSITKMMELLDFGAHAIGVVEQQSQGLESSWRDIIHTMEIDLEHFKKTVATFINCFEEITLIKTITVHEKARQEDGKSGDLELGKSQTLNVFGICGLRDEEMDKMVSSYLIHSTELIDKFGSHQSDLKGQHVLCLSALGFCISGIIRETREMKEGIKELVQWDNPSSHIDLYEISCKMHDLQK